MSELQNPETNHADETLLLAGYLKPKDLAKALDVSERTIARWHHFREGQDKGFTVLWTPFVKFSFFGARFIPSTASPCPVLEQSTSEHCFRSSSARESQYQF